MHRNILNKTVLITGSNEGIGFETSLKFASRKWKVLMADKNNLDKAKEKIAHETLNCNISTYHLDLSIFKSIRNFINNLKCDNEIKCIDVLINNAGIFKSHQSKTDDNLDPVMQINHYGPFLLTILLLDLLKNSEAARIIFVTSSGAYFSNLNLNALPNPHFNSDNFLLNYYNSKLCNIIIAKELASRVEKFNIISTCLHPGMTNTKFLFKNDYFDGVSRILQKLVQLFTQDTKISAEMVFFVATSKSIGHFNGEYFENYQVKTPPKLVDEKIFCEKIWKQAEEIVGLAEEEKINFNKL